ncbi:MAG: hypothetical protein ACOX0F_03720 [Syntrophomonadaceae bacterium]|jgi:hypothetical protein
MKEKKEKKGLLQRLLGGKDDKGSCCCNFKIIELPEDKESSQEHDDEAKIKGK